MEEYYTALAQALRSRLSLIANHQLRDQDPAAHMAKLKEASEQIDRLTAHVPSNADPRLVHYLQRSSLSKALEFVEQNYIQ